MDAFRKAAAGLVPPEEIVRLGFSVASAVEEREAVEERGAVEEREAVEA
jgi:hypothetical protein